MPTVPVHPTVRAILSTNINLTTDEIIRKARDKGVAAPDTAIRKSIYNLKGELRKKVVAPAAARTTKAPKPAPAPTAVSAPISLPSSSDLSSMLANVALVNTVVGVCGGIEPARQVAEAVRACGNVEAFLQHLDLVAGIRGV